MPKIIILYRTKRVVLMSMSVSAFSIIATKMLFARIQKQVSIVSAIKVTKVMVLLVMISMNACKMIFARSMPFVRILMARMTATVMEILDLKSPKMDALTLMNAGMNAMKQLRKHSE